MSDSVIETSGNPAANTPERSAADLRMRRFLRIPDDKVVTHEEAQSAFQTSIAVSAIRCTLAYVVLPFVAPLIGVAASVAAPLGIVVALVALTSITYSMRRFFGSDHPKRWTYAAVAGVMVCFLMYLLVSDISAVVT